MDKSGIKWDGILIRFVTALFLVFLSYNPSGYSYFHWVRNALPDYTPLMIFAGVVLLILWVIFLRATLRSLGLIGLILTFAFFGTLVWLLVDWKLVPVDNVEAVSYIVLAVLSAVLAIGMSWSHIRRRITGQVDVDDVEPE
ncbi:MAG: hypothetical protein GY807_18690 [Gammaproteobacteria bacterium]|nr:hypothetical protein [Gammaproteobacteria bacterium]